MHTGRSLRPSWVLVLVAILVVLGSGGFTVAQSMPNQPVQPLQPEPTNVPGSRPGTIPTIDPDSDLPTRPPRQTPTPVPTLESPLGVPTPTATEVQPNPQPNLTPVPTVAPQPKPKPGDQPGDTLPTVPSTDPNPVVRYATISFSPLMCEQGWTRVLEGGGLKPPAEFAENCTLPIGPMTFVVFEGWLPTSGQAQDLQRIQTEDNLVTFTVPADSTYIAGPTYGAYWSIKWCTSEARPTPWLPKGTGAKGLSVVYPQPGENIHCMAYFPWIARAKLTIDMWTCPAGYSPQAANAVPSEDCAPTYGGIPLRLYHGLSHPIEAVPGGPNANSVTFGPLPANVPTTYTVGIPTLAPSFTVGCHDSQPLMMGPSLHMTVAPGESRTCDWFVVPPA